MEDRNITDALINDFAIRCFRDQGDADYIAARMAFRAALAMPSLWSSQQTIEKYLKCILLLNRIRGGNVGHDLNAALSLITKSACVSLDLSPATTSFIEHIDAFGRFRYLEVSRIAYGGHVISLDRAVWELRRYCTISEGPSSLKLRNGSLPPKYRIEGGFLEQVIDDGENAAHKPLLVNNAFLGKRRRRKVRARKWFCAENAPLYLNPQILDEILEYVHLPKGLIRAYRLHQKPD
jgi:hypothetical protein